MSFAAAVLLGAIQGLTEFLPVSSSAHLLLARAFFGWELPPEFGLAFDVALHVGTLAAILVFFRVEILGMVRALPEALSSTPSPDARLLRLIIIGTHPDGHRRGGLQRSDRAGAADAGGSRRRRWRSARC